MLQMLANKVFDSRTETTIGIDFRCLDAIGFPTTVADYNKATQHDPKTQLTYYKLQCWDCAGQIRFRSIVKSYYRLAHIVFVVFDLTDRESFEQVTAWTNDVRANMIDQEYAMILIGNKCDLINDRVVTDREIWNLVGELKFHAYTPTSAKTGQNLEDAINVGLSKAHELIIDGKIKMELNHAFQIEDKGDDQAKPGCMKGSCF
jgi:small GTP-binding protein